METYKFKAQMESLGIVIPCVKVHYNFRSLRIARAERKAINKSLRENDWLPYQKNDYK